MQSFKNEIFEKVSFWFCSFSFYLSYTNQVYSTRDFFLKRQQQFLNLNLLVFEIACMQPYNFSFREAIISTFILMKC